MARPSHIASGLCVLVLVSDLLTSLSPFFAMVGYFSLIYLVFQFVDFSRLAAIELALVLILGSSVVFTAVHSNSELTIGLKYLLLVTIFGFSFFKKRTIDNAHLFWLFKFPLLVLVFTGLFQLFLMLVNPALIVPYLQGHFRPIGLSVEPTFYSQQLVLLWILSDLCGMNNVRGRLIFELLIVVLILVCATRSSMLAMMLFLLFRSGLKARFTLIVFSALSVPFVMTKFSEIALITQIGSKISNIFSIAGEPREVALNAMLIKIQDLPTFGYGFVKLVSNSGLETGSLYANLFIAMFFSMGLLSLVPLSILFFRIILSPNIATFLCCSIIFLFSLVMPFLYTGFGMFFFLSVFSVLGDTPNSSSHADLSFFKRRSAAF